MSDFEVNPHVPVIGAGALIGGVAVSVGLSLAQSIAAHRRSTVDAECRALAFEMTDLIGQMRLNLERRRIARERDEANRLSDEADQQAHDDYLRARLAAARALNVRA